MADTALEQLQAQYDAFVRDNVPRHVCDTLDARLAGLPAFLHDVHTHHPSCGGVAFVTSGGTRVALEVNAVRFLTNFSSGGRGACLVEGFVRRGWACVLLHHATAALPYRRVLDALSTRQLFALCGGAGGGAHDTNNAHDDADATTARRVRRLHAAYVASRRLVYYVAYDTVAEYLYLLQRLACLLAHDMPHTVSLRTRPLLFFAAAAVSDYYVPMADMSPHKISQPDGVTLHLAAVPKVLLLLRHRWLRRDADAPPTLFVAFKLETSEATLREKAVRSLRACACDAVVANMLQTYKQQVLLYVAGEEADAPRVVQRRRCGRQGDGVRHNDDSNNNNNNNNNADECDDDDEHTVEDALVRVFVDMATARGGRGATA